MVVVGGGYTGMWAAWHLKALEPEARVVLLEAADLRAWAERPQRRLLQRDVALAAEHARALGRRGGARGRRASRGGGRRDRRVLRGRGGRRLVSPRRLPQGLDRRGPRRIWTRGGRRLPRARGDRTRSQALDAERRSPRAALAGLSRRRLLPRLGDGAAGAARARPARAAARGRASRSTRPRRCERCARRPTASRRGPPAARCGPAPRCWRSAAPLPAARARCATGSRSTSSHIVLTEPVPELLEEIGWTGGECITDCRTLVHYFRTTPDGRIAFGWGGGRISFGAGLDGRAEVDPEVVDLAASACAPSSRGSRGAGSPTPGAARSTPRRPTCRW